MHVLKLLGDFNWQAVHRIAGCLSQSSRSNLTHAHETPLKNYKQLALALDLTSNFVTSNLQFGVVEASQNQIPEHT